MKKEWRDWTRSFANPYIVDLKDKKVSNRRLGGPLKAQVGEEVRRPEATKGLKMEIGDDHHRVSESKQKFKEKNRSGDKGSRRSCVGEGPGKKIRNN